MAEAVYALCAFTALACAAMLVRGYRRSGTRLLLWASLCFIALTVNNILLYVDLVVIPGTNLAALRSSIALAGLSVLLFGLVWDRP
jgi:hypothetical protein